MIIIFLNLFWMPVCLMGWRLALMDWFWPVSNSTQINLLSALFFWFQCFTRDCIDLCGLRSLEEEIFSKVVVLTSLIELMHSCKNNLHNITCSSFENFCTKPHGISSTWQKSSNPLEERGTIFFFNLLSKCLCAACICQVNPTGLSSHLKQDPYLLLGLRQRPVQSWRLS